MLTPEQFDILVDPFMALYEEFEISIIRDIAARITKMGKPTSTAAWQAQRLLESGSVFKNFIKELSILTGRSERLLAKQFREAGVQSLAFDDEIYRLAGLKPLPLNQSPAMSQLLLAGIEKTNGVIRNLTLTTANSSQQLFIQSLDLAYMQVTSGAMSYDQAIRQAIKSVGTSGLKVFYPSGHVDKLDVAVRRAVLTGTGQTTNKLQWIRAEQMGVDLVETSAHIGARPSHQIWQGKVFSRSGNDKRYPDFISSTGYGTGQGLGGYNCRHSYYPYFPGISERVYSKATLDNISRQSVKYNGKTLSVYDATQIQRGIERKIRMWKRQQEAFDAAKLSNAFETRKVKQWQAKMRSFIKQTKLSRQYVREKV